jgi:Fe-S-cluster containining protein
VETGAQMKTRVVSVASMALRNAAGAPRASARDSIATICQLVEHHQVLTFAETLEATSLLDEAGRRTSEAIAASNGLAVDHARQHLRVISCFACAAPKACCTMVTGAYLHEGAVVAARIVAERRDTPALRAELRTAAERMETSDVTEYRQPCAFLGADDRCTVYEDRPSICGVHLVSSPAAACRDAPSTTVSAVVGTAHVDLPRAACADFAAALGLPALEHPYRGALPRMVLACLDAWHRRDFASYLAGTLVPAIRRYRWAIKA